jgi:chromate transporter
MELFRYFLRLGAAGFGGPIALVGYMEREFVERRGWVSREELNDGIAFSQLAPGPLAAQVAIYLGWLCAGVRGATASGIAFVGPSFVMVVILAWSYQRFGGMSWLQGAFYGIGAAVIAIVARSAIKLTRTTLGRDRLLWTLFIISATVTAWREAELVWLFLLCGVITLIVRGQFARGGVVAPVFLFSYRLAAPTVLASAGEQRQPSVQYSCISRRQDFLFSGVVSPLSRFYMTVSCVSTVGSRSDSFSTRWPSR